MTILDTGANFSLIHKHFCVKHNFPIIPCENSEPIKLADSKSSVQRIGIAKLNVQCDGKTSTHNFEVMNLTNNHNMSIGTDLMSELGIGLTGSPYKWNNNNSNNNQANTLKYNDNSEILDETDKEIREYEDCPAGSPGEYELAIKEVKPFIQLNQNIPKGSFCTIPESAVC